MVLAIVTGSNDTVSLIVILSILDDLPWESNKLICFHKFG